MLANQKVVIADIIPSCWQHQVLMSCVAAHLGTNHSMAVASDCDYVVGST